jgi:hypothetical protein
MELIGIVFLSVGIVFFCVGIESAFWLRNEMKRLERKQKEIERGKR